jgi:PIN domain nuclease of toxin-antitoxin system
VSAVSAWEIEIKRAIGKLEAPEDLLGAIAANDFERLDIKGSIEFRMQMFIANTLMLCSRAESLENSSSPENQHRES